MWLLLSIVDREAYYFFVSIKQILLAEIDDVVSYPLRFVSYLKQVNF